MADEGLAKSIRAANSAKHAFELAEAAQVDIAGLVAVRAWETAAKALQHLPCTLDIVIFNRDGAVLARHRGETCTLSPLAGRGA